MEKKVLQLLKRDAPKISFNKLVLPSDFSKCQCHQGSPFLHIKKDNLLLDLRR